MKTTVAVIFFGTLCLGAEPVRIATAPADVVPHDGGGTPQRVAMSGYHFEVNEETRRARIVVEYAYQNPAALGAFEDNGPAPAYIQIEGLAYDPTAHAVTWTHNGRTVTCGMVNERSRRKVVTATNACRVTAREAVHDEDDGWSIHHRPAIDLFIESR